MFLLSFSFAMRRTVSMMTAPSWPAFAGDAAHRLFERAAHDGDAGLDVFLVRLDVASATSMALTSATPPPGTMPSSTAARVALSASSTRCFFSFSSVSVAAPTRMMATPPLNLARRSCSFSLS